MALADNKSICIYPECSFTLLRPEIHIGDQQANLVDVGWGSRPLFTRKAVPRQKGISKLLIAREDFRWKG